MAAVSVWPLTTSLRTAAKRSRTRADSACSTTALSAFSSGRRAVSRLES